MDADESREVGNRMRLPEFRDDEALRSVLDRSLRLLTLDLTNHCSESLGVANEHWDTKSSNQGRPLQPADPLFWIDELLFHGSAAYNDLPVTARVIEHDLKAVRRHRHELYHFAHEYTPTIAIRALDSVLTVARRLALPCQEELRALRASLQSPGLKGHGPASTKAVLRSVEEAVVARKRLEKAERESERLTEKLERAEDAADTLRLSLERGDTANVQALARIAELDTEVVRARQEAEIQGSHANQLAAQLEALQAVEPPRLSTALVTPLGDVYRGFVNQRLVVEGAIAQGRFIDPGEQENPMDEFTGLENQLRSLLPIVPAIPVDPLRTPEELGARQSEAHHAFKAMGQVLAGVEMELAQLGVDPDAEAPADQALVLGLLSDAVTAWDRVSDWFLAGLQHVAVAASSESGDEALPDPGEHWPYVRGNDVWVLSAARRTVRRPRGIVAPTLSDSIRPATVARLVEDWLAIRPEGGRVYIDVDGDACTPSPDGSYMYLGKVPHYPS